MRLIFATVATVSLLFGGCAEPPRRPVLPEITSESKEGYFDLVFGIREHKKLPDGGQTILAFGMHNNREVGLEIVLASSWQQDSMNAVPTNLGIVIYRSVGAESDLLLQALDQLYETKQYPKTMNRETVFSALTVEGDPRELTNGPVRIKLFFESDEEDRSAELYTIIDLKARKLYISDDDQEYRANTIRALKSS